MTADFGVGARRRAPIGRIIAVVWIVALLGAAGAKFFLDRQAAINNDMLWTAIGSPCPAEATPPNDG